MPLPERFSFCRLVSAKITRRERENESKRLTTGTLHNAAQPAAWSTGEAVDNEGMREFGIVKRERAYSVHVAAAGERVAVLRVS
jgi:hypothetical protein